MPRLALLSVSDKRGLIPFARGLVAEGFTLLSTGGTKSALEEAGVPVTAVSAYTGAPEVFGGRVKTLHPRIHGGLLGRRRVDDEVAAAHGIAWIDVVAVNLYPFAATVAGGADLADAVEQIDIGGPAMVRAAAKNHASVHVVVDPDDYDAVLEDLERDVPALRGRLAVKAFRHTAVYDAQVSSWLGAQLDPEDTLPSAWALPLTRVQGLRYGENPHQDAAFYAVSGEGGRSLARARQLQGKELSFNNLADLDAAVRTVFDLEGPGAVVVKHMNPCGAATHPAGGGPAFTLALSADPVSAYGGILALNVPVDGAIAATILETRVFFEVIVAPGFDLDAQAAFSRRPNLRVVALPDDWASVGPSGFDLRRVQGGVLVQAWDHAHTTAWRTALRAPSDDETLALRFAWAVCRNVKSNAIVLARAEADGACVLNGVGAGQMSRVDAVRLAVAKATRATEGSVLASDAFFPFADGVEVAIAAGVTAIAQPGGSVRDEEVVVAAGAAGLAMQMTGARHFRH